MLIKNITGLFISFALFASCQALAQRSIAVTMPPDVQLEAAVMIDVVFVYEQTVVDKLPFEQFGWISSRSEMLLRFANALDVVSIEIVPGSMIKELELPQRVSDAVAVLVYASHEDPVAESIDITADSKVLLQVEDWGIDVQPL